MQRPQLTKEQLKRPVWPQCVEKRGDSSPKSDQRGARGLITEGLVNPGAIWVIFMFHDVCCNIMSNSKQFLPKQSE